MWNVHRSYTLFGWLIFAARYCKCSAIISYCMRKSLEYELLIFYYVLPYRFPIVPQQLVHQISGEGVISLRTQVSFSGSQFRENQDRSVDLSPKFVLVKIRKPQLNSKTSLHSFVQFYIRSKN